MNEVIAQRRRRNPTLGFHGIVRTSLAALVAAAACTACGGGSNSVAGSSDIPSSEVHEPVQITPGYSAASADSFLSKLEYVAGNSAGLGYVDGPLAVATINGAYGMTMGPDGSLYLAHSSTLRRITPQGQVTTLAGLPDASGTIDGIGAEARLDGARSIAMDMHGNLYFTEDGSHTVRMMSPAGAVMTVAGKPGEQGDADGVRSDARFTQPAGITADTQGNLYVNDGHPEYLVQPRIRRIDASGRVSTLIPRNSSVRITGTGVAVAPDGDVYAMGTINNETVSLPTLVTSSLYPHFSMEIRDHPVRRLLKLSPTGDVTALATVPDMYRPAFGDMAVDVVGNVYVTDNYRHEVLKYSEKTNTFSVLAGGVAGPEMMAAETVILGFPCRSESLICNPVGVAAAPDGRVYVSQGGGTMSSSYYNIVRLEPNGDETLYAGRTRAMSLTGAFASTITGMVSGADGTLYFVGGGSQFAKGNQLYRYDGKQAVLIAGSAGGAAIDSVTVPPDGTGSDAAFNWISHMTMDTVGNLYVLDQGNGLGIALRKITPDGVVKTLAGRWSDNTASAGDPSAFLFPGGVAVDSDGNLFVADTTQIRRIAPDGSISRYAGHASFPNVDEYADFPGVKRIVDGTAASATFADIVDLVIDQVRNLYVLEIDSRSVSGERVIRRIDLQGNVSTLVRFNSDGNHLAIDADGSLYVHGGKQLFRRLADGSVRLLAEAPQKPTALAASGRNTLFVAIGDPSGLFRFTPD
ncbi:MAG TPA: hypothetical protein VJ698_01480 [Noviherbaspirillum sp.]|uniref:hypothetical protein n=1 Tax=Noviherbaspirillum sp. TaxID=1926288 RepID=UPI002B47E413|nr:hypothetical protein [Noviherbaspirillum sp.]HJV84119.1 hypothetical protein [Noviherbaspirillum sp.]